MIATDSSMLINQLWRPLSCTNTIKINYEDIILTDWLKMLKGISLKLSQHTLLCWWYLVSKLHWHRPSRKKVMKFQSQKSGKTISPFLSDQVLMESVARIPSVLNDNYYVILPQVMVLWFYRHDRECTQVTYSTHLVAMIVPAGGNYIFNMTTSLLEALIMYTRYFKKAYSTREFII